MEPRQPEKPVESRGEDQPSPPRQPGSKRRFRIVKLEERIAPGTFNSNFCGNGSVACYISHKHYCAGGS